MKRPLDEETMLPLPCLTEDIARYIHGAVVSFGICRLPHLAAWHSLCRAFRDDWRRLAYVVPLLECAIEAQRRAYATTRHGRHLRMMTPLFRMRVARDACVRILPEETPPADAPYLPNCNLGGRWDHRKPQMTIRKLIGDYGRNMRILTHRTGEEPLTECEATILFLTSSYLSLHHGWHLVIEVAGVMRVVHDYLSAVTAHNIKLSCAIYLELSLADECGDD